VILCSGKVRWDLLNRRSQQGKDGQVAILGVERLYPLPAKQLANHLGRFDNVAEVRWVQEEPANQGAWPFMALNLPGALADQVPGRTWKLTPVTRPASSAPAVGSAKVHEAQQRALLDAAFA
jgi:2-oxoglutarate decarboxylase